MANMSTKPNVSSEPLAFGLTGFKLDDVMSTKFLSEFRKAFPTAITTAIVFGFTDSKEGIIIEHDRDHDSGKFNMERVDVEGSKPDLNVKAKDVLVRVFS